MDNFSFSTFVWTKDYLESILFYGKHRLITDPNIQNAFKKVDRVHFVPDNHRASAYEDKDIDIGFDQKIYKPTTTAKLINAINPKPGGNYLMIGAGTGYMSAILGTVAGKKGKVVTLERVLMILDIFRKNFENYPQLKDIVEPVFKDGIKGYPSSGPYDAILYSVALESNPIQVVAQLKVNGRIVVPRQDKTIRIITRLDNTNWSEKVYKDPIFFDKVLTGIE